MTDATESLPGQRVWDRLDARMARRQAVGVPSRLYERMGLGDPWSWQPPVSGESTDNDDYAFLSGRPFYAMMRRMALSRFWRERRERWADVGPQRSPAKRRRRANRFDWSLGTSDFVLPPAWEAPAQEAEVGEAPVAAKAVSGWTGARTSSGSDAWQTASVPSTATVIRGGKKDDASAGAPAGSTTSKNRRAIELVAESGRADRIRRASRQRPAGLRRGSDMDELGGAGDAVVSAPARQRRRGVRYRTARRVADAELLRQLEAPTPTPGTTAVQARSPFLSAVSAPPGRAARPVTAEASSASSARPAPRPTERAAARSAPGATPGAASDVSGVSGGADAPASSAARAPVQRSLTSAGRAASTAAPSAEARDASAAPLTAERVAQRVSRTVPATERLAQRAVTTLPTAARAAAPDIGTSRPSMRWEGPMAPEGRRRVLRVASPSLSWLLGGAPETEVSADAPASRPAAAAARPAVSAWPAPRAAAAPSASPSASTSASSASPVASPSASPAARQQAARRADVSETARRASPEVSAESPPSARPTAARAASAVQLSPVEQTLRAMGASTSVMRAVREAVESGAREIPAPAARLLERTLPLWERPSARASSARPAEALRADRSVATDAGAEPAQAAATGRRSSPGVAAQRVVRVAAPEEAPPDRIEQLIRGVERSAASSRPRRSVWISPNEVLLVPEGDPVPTNVAPREFTGARSVSGWARPSSPVGRAASVALAASAPASAATPSVARVGRSSTLIPPAAAAAFRTPSGEWRPSAAFRAAASAAPASASESAGVGIISRTVAGVWAGATRADRSAPSVRAPSGARAVSTDAVLASPIEGGPAASQPAASQPYAGARTVSGWSGAATAPSSAPIERAAARGAGELPGAVERAAERASGRAATPSAGRRLDAGAALGLSEDAPASARGQRRRPVTSAPSQTALSPDAPVAREQAPQASGQGGRAASPFFSPVSQAVSDAWSGPPRAGTSSAPPSRVPTSTTRVSRTPSALRGTTRNFRTASSVWTGAVLSRTPQGEWTGAASGRTPQGEWTGAASGRTPSGAWTGAASGRTPSGKWTGAASGRTPQGEWTGAASGRTPSGEWVGAVSGRTPSGAWTGATSGVTPSSQRGASWAAPGRTSLMQSLAAVGDGEDTVNLPSWARVVTAEPIRRRSSGDLVTALARASQPEQVIRVILERAGQPVPANLPAPIAEVVRQVTGEAAKVGASASRSTSGGAGAAASSASSATVIRGGAARARASARSVRTRGGDRRSSARVVSGWTGLVRGVPSTAKTASSGVGGDRMMRLASRLKELIHLAEGQKLSEARKQARLSAEGTGPEGGRDDARPGGTGEQEVDIDILSREVLEIVMQELELRRARRVEDSDVGLWW